MSQIRECVFQDVHTSDHGSAISCASKIDYNLFGCVFLNCSCSFQGISSARPTNEASGGACFFDINNLNAKSCYFYKCSGAGLGAAIYCAGPISKKCEASCLSSFMCFNAQSSIHSVFAFELFSSIITSINSSYDIQKSHYGALTIGRYPKEYSLNYMNFIFNSIKEETSSEYILCLSLDTLSNGNTKHMFVGNAESQNGLIAFWPGNHILSDCIFAQCKGRLRRVFDGNPTIKFIDCNFDPNIIISNVDISNCSTSPTFSYFRLDCALPHLRILTCFIKVKSHLTTHKHLFIFLGISSQ